jgi:adrenodoxin-NADP+ reductase
VIGRRGHIQGAFTIKELRELTKLDEEGHQASFFVSQDELDMGTTDSSVQELQAPSGRPKTRIDDLLRRVASTPPAENPKRISLTILTNPVRFEASEHDPSMLGAVICERTRLEGGPGQQRGVGTGELVTIPAQLALVSVGYKGVAIPGLAPEVFDSHRGLVVNTHGKVTDASNGLAGLYVSGWLKRGPSGIIGTNITDAKDTVGSIVKDLEHQIPKILPPR